MKYFASVIVALSLMSGTALAQPGGHGGSGPPACGQPGQPACTQQGQPPGQQREPPGQQRQPPGQQAQPPGQQGQPPGQSQFNPQGPRWSRGDRLPDQYQQPQNVVTDWRTNNLSAPPRGYRWMCYQGGNCFLVRTTTGVIRDTRWRDDRDTYWNQHYTREYTYNDDLYYRECRNRPDPSGILLGGLIGGLIGHAADNRNSGATFAGIILGAAAGAALTNNLDCNDRNYAYRAYYDALNSGRAGVIHRWRNPSNNHYGNFQVRSYYSDQHGFQCANYRHDVYIDRLRRASGRACRQPDGAWAFLS